MSNKKNHKQNNQKAKNATAQKVAPADPFLSGIHTDDDFARIVVGVANVDVCLVSILDKFLVDCTTKDQMLSHTGFVGNIAARAKLCYTLGLITKSVFTEVITLAELRNMLAHGPQKLTFYSSEVKEAVLEMKWLHSWIDRNYGAMPEFTDLMNKEIQNKFTTTIAILCMELNAISGKIEQRKAAAEELSMFHMEILDAEGNSLNELPKHLKDRAEAAKNK